MSALLVTRIAPVPLPRRRRDAPHLEEDVLVDEAEVVVQLGDGAGEDTLLLLEGSDRQGGGARGGVADRTHLLRRGRRQRRRHRDARLTTHTYIHTVDRREHNRHISTAVFPFFVSKNIFKKKKKKKTSASHVSIASREKTTKNYNFYVDRVIKCRLYGNQCVAL